MGSGDEVEFVLEPGVILCGGGFVGRVDDAVAVVVEVAGDRRGGGEGIAGGELVGGVDFGVGGGVAGLAGGVAEVEGLIGGEAAVCAGFEGDAEPLALDGVIGEGDGDAGPGVGGVAGIGGEGEWRGRRTRWSCRCRRRG